MSGGSFNYLYAKQMPELLEGGNLDTLKEMLEELKKLGYAGNAAEETAKLIQMIEEIKKAETRADGKLTALKEVFMAVEWWRSGDSGEDDVKKAVTKYNAAKQKQDSKGG